MKKTQTPSAITPESGHTPPMKVDVKISSIRPEGSLKAIASVNLNDCFAIRNVKVMESSKGLFAAMPSYKAGNGEYKDICFPITKEFRQQFNDAVVNAYQQALTQNQHKGMTQTSPKEPVQDSGMNMGGM
jgi:stage V sporulation protein G